MTSIPVLYLDMISSNLVLYLDFNDVIKLASYFTDQFKVNTLFEISFSSYCNYYYYYYWYCFCQFAFLYFFLFIPRIFFWVEKWNFFSVCVQVQSKMGNIEKLTVTFVLVWYQIMGFLVFWYKVKRFLFSSLDPIKRTLKKWVITRHLKITFLLSLINATNT